MSEERDFEHRLGQGLKRWATAGEPTMDLEAYVLGTAGNGRNQPRSRVRWVVGSAAAAVLFLGVLFSFPAWAGAASGWPLVGPVITKIIMQDAGLKWAYENDLIQGTVAEASQDGVSVRILGVMAGSARTTFIYQIVGLPEPPKPEDQPAKPVSAHDLFFDSRPTGDLPQIRIRKLPGDTPPILWLSQPTWTPVGLVGTAHTSPLSTTEGDIALTFSIDGRNFDLTFPASRSAVDNLSKEIPVNQTQVVGDIRITVQSVIYSPMDTVVKYKVEKPEFHGGWSWGGTEMSMRLEAGGEQLHSFHSFNTADYTLDAFPPVKGPVRLVFPAQVKAVAAALTWPLGSGSVQQAAGTDLVLDQWERQGNRIAVRWTYRRIAPFVSFGSFKVVDAAGTIYDVKEGSTAWGGFGSPEAHTTVELELPPGVEPVAVRSEEIAVAVMGPWTFDLPR